MLDISILDISICFTSPHILMFLKVRIFSFVQCAYTEEWAQHFFTVLNLKLPQNEL